MGNVTNPCRVKKKPEDKIKKSLIIEFYFNLPTFILVNRYDPNKNNKQLFFFIHS